MIILPLFYEHVVVVHDQHQLPALHTGGSHILYNICTLGGLKERKFLFLTKPRLVQTEICEKSDSQSFIFKKSFVSLRQANFSENNLHKFVLERGVKMIMEYRIIVKIKNFFFFNHRNVPMLE